MGEACSFKVGNNVFCLVTSDWVVIPLHGIGLIYDTKLLVSSQLVNTQNSTVIPLTLLRWLL